MTPNHAQAWLCSCGQPATYCGPMGNVCDCCGAGFVATRELAKTQAPELDSEASKAAARAWAADVEKYERDRKLKGTVVDGLMQQALREPLGEERDERVSQLCEGLGADERAELRRRVLDVEVRELEERKARAQRLADEAEEHARKQAGKNAPTGGFSPPQGLSAWLPESMSQGLKDAYRDVGSELAKPREFYGSGIPLKLPSLPGYNAVISADADGPAPKFVPPPACSCGSTALERDSAKKESLCTKCGRTTRWVFP